MVAYSFKARFADPIETGRKRQTIRKDRRRHARPGETIQLYTAQRTIHCRRIGTATCVAVHRIEIGIDAGDLTVRIDGTAQRDLDALARADGFDDAQDFRAFWERENGLAPGNPFLGVLIKWADHGQA